MIELILKMTFWLVTAMGLGFIMAWFLSKIVYQKRYLQEKESLEEIIAKQSGQLTRLRKEFKSEKEMSRNLVDKVKETEKNLLETTTLLENKNKEQSDSALELEIKKLKSIALKKEEALESFDEVLLLAETREEENNHKHKIAIQKLQDEIKELKSIKRSNQKAIKHSNQTIEELKKDLLLYQADTSEAEFIMKKEQFVKIEEQLGIYAQEIEEYKKENVKLKKSLLESKRQIYANLNIKAPSTLTKIEGEVEDGSVVKVFRETYRKITNS